MTETVREQVRMGRLLPLGDPVPAGTGWIAEGAAREVLIGDVAGVPGTRVLRLRFAPDGDAAPLGWEERPAAGLPRGAVRLEAEVLLSGEEPLPETADRVRTALTVGARTLSLPVTAVDVRVNGLLEPGTADAAAPEGTEPDGTPTTVPDTPAARAPIGSDPTEGGDADPLARAVVAALTAIAGVRGTVPFPGPAGRSVRITPAGDTEWVEVQLALARASATGTTIAEAARAAAAAAGRRVRLLVVRLDGPEDDAEAGGAGGA
ncbi:hypothetical protein [Streptomyces sp. ST2-7A]|uniref:hypothetical protein n=1 Tax=Streptomyces sp. ST2-7A TaxID=2907214 RepID=UPI001F48910B|nr:hypothetical protein [Streptomyces sp. ST2-7A]MCE7082238.1 hypothetical protein [Streptomyces sp. ST2-7A]